MLAITELKKGTIFELDNVPYKVLEYQQKVMGRGGSIVNVRIKSLIDGRVLDKTFKGSEQLERADVSTENFQYLYADGGQYHFMNTKSYEQLSANSELLGDQAVYLKEGDELKAQIFRGQIVSVELPKNVYLKVEYAEGAVKGDTSSAVTKEAKLETGLVVKVPAFIKTGDIISVDTTTGAYRERKKG